MLLENTKCPIVRNGIVYGVFAFASWLAPSIVIAIGPRLSMILAALTYAFQISQYLYLNAGSVYFASVLIGFGAPIIWTAQVKIAHCNQRNIDYTNSN